MKIVNTKKIKFCVFCVHFIWWKTHYDLLKTRNSKFRTWPATYIRTWLGSSMLRLETYLWLDKQRLGPTSAWYRMALFFVLKKPSRLHLSPSSGASESIGWTEVCVYRLANTFPPPDPEQPLWLAVNQRAKWNMTPENDTSIFWFRLQPAAADLNYTSSNCCCSQKTC